MQTNQVPCITFAVRAAAGSVAVAAGSVSVASSTASVAASTVLIAAGSASATASTAVVAAGSASATFCSQEFQSDSAVSGARLVELDDTKWAACNANLGKKLHGFHGLDPKGDNKAAYLCHRMYTLRVGEDCKAGEVGAVQWCVHVPEPEWPARPAVSCI